MFFLFEKKNFYDDLNLELGSGRKITAKLVLSPMYRILKISLYNQIF